jgi:hypothetical protein
VCRLLYRSFAAQASATVVRRRRLSTDCEDYAISDPRSASDLLPWHTQRPSPLCRLYEVLGNTNRHDASACLRNRHWNVLGFLAFMTRMRQRRGREEILARLFRCLVDLIGIEPMTSSMPWKRAPSCATGPLPRKDFPILADAGRQVNLIGRNKPLGCGV